MLDSQAYFALPGVSSHMLIELMRSPLHCWTKYLDPNRVREEPTSSQLLGTVAHALTLTPERFNDEFVVLSHAVNRRRNEGRAEVARLQHTGRQPISTKVYQTALAVAKAVRQDPLARGLLIGGEPEKTLLAPRATGLLPLKGRLDYLYPQPRIVELKTTMIACKDHFLRDVYRYGYHLSAAYYRMLVSEYTQTPAEQIPHTFIVVETKPPYAVAVYHTSERLLTEGRTLWETQLARFDECWRNEDWPGYPVDSLEARGGDSARLRFEIQEGELEL